MSYDYQTSGYHQCTSTEAGRSVFSYTFVNKGIQFATVSSTTSNPSNAAVMRDYTYRIFDILLLLILLLLLLFIAATLALMTSTTEGSARVLRSPSWSPSPAMILRMIRRMIYGIISLQEVRGRKLVCTFPDRVFGKSDTM